MMRRRGCLSMLNNTLYRAWSHAAKRRRPRSTLGKAWVDLSLRTKLLLFALFLVALPGGVFALIAFSGARSALEREVGIQLYQTADQGAGAVVATLQRAQSEARSWAAQDLMRDLVVGDLDKRVSKSLATITGGNAAYLDVLCVDGEGQVVAASDGKWLGHDVGNWSAMAALRTGSESVAGPMQSDYPDRQVLKIGVPIENPDVPGAQIGVLVLIYDWGAVRSILEGIRLKLVQLGKRVVMLVIDHDGRVIGSDSGPRDEILGSAALRRATWEEWVESGYGTRTLNQPDDRPVEVLIGSARVADRQSGWSVLVLEPVSEAFAPVQTIRQRWLYALAAILLLGLAIAAILARQVVRPLDEVTRATSTLTSHLDGPPTLLPVSSRNEVGQLAESFNNMTVELKRSQEETLSAAKFAFAGELAAMIAHEIRTPLTVMRSSAQMLAGPRAGRSTDKAELAETIVAEVDRIQGIVKDLLQLVRPLPQQIAPAPLQEVLQRAADFVANQADKQKVRIETDFAASPSLALCDPEQIYQVVLNLVVNALQVLPDGGFVRLRTLPENSGTVGFEVGDSGPGLPESIRETIFQPFVSGREGGDWAWVGVRRTDR